MSDLNPLDETWAGTATELVAEISRIVGEAVPEPEINLNVRLLRHYQDVGAVSRPERRGRDAIYGYRHLLEVLVVRALVLDDWPLKKVADITGTASDDELRGMLPLVQQAASAQPTPANRAQELVRQFALESGEPLAAREASATISYEARTPRAQRPDVRPRWRTLVDIPLPHGARLTIEPERLEHLSPQDVRRIAEALERGLRIAQRDRQKSKKSTRSSRT